MRVNHQAEVGDDVLNLLALVERQPAIDAVVDAVLPKLLLKDSRLGIRPVENGKVAPFQPITSTDSQQLTRHIASLLLVGSRLKHGNGLTLFPVRIDLLGNAALVVGNDAVGSAHDGLRRAIVLLQLEQARMVVAALEGKDIVDAGTAETVDTLRVVAHHTDVLMARCQLPHNFVLRQVRILILIHQHKAETFPITLQDVLVLFKKVIRQHQQVIEVHCVSQTKAMGIALIDVAYGGQATLHVFLIHGRVVVIHASRDEDVLRFADARLHGVGFVHLVIQPHLLDDGLDEAARIALVVNGEVGSIAQRLGLPSEDFRKETVECPHPEVACRLLAHSRGNTAFHLCRSLVGESEREDFPRLVALHLHQMGNLVRQYARLA